MERTVHDRWWRYFISDMLIKAGFQNVFANKQRYPIITVEELQAANCKLLLLSSEPYPFKQKHIDKLQLHLPNTKSFSLTAKFLAGMAAVC